MSPRYNQIRTQQCERGASYCPVGLKNAASKNAVQVFRARLVSSVWQIQLFRQILGDPFCQLEWKKLLKGVVLAASILECLFTSLVAPRCCKTTAASVTLYLEMVLHRGPEMSGRIEKWQTHTQI
jgi:hypothetical protein